MKTLISALFITLGLSSFNTASAAIETSFKPVIEQDERRPSFVTRRR